MFEAAVTKFAKSIGNANADGSLSLIPVPDLDDAKLCQPFYIVSKKNRRWVWQSPKYFPTDFMIHNLMVNSDRWEDQIKVERSSLLTYNSSNKFSVHGKIGAKLMKIFEADLQGGDSVTVTATFGQVDRSTVDEPALMEAIGKRKLDMDNTFVQQTRKQTRRVLCIIVGCVQLAQGGSISRSTSESASSSVDENKIVSVAADIDEDESVARDLQSSFQLPKDTVLAYRVRELLVNSSGDLELVVVDEMDGGFAAKQQPTEGFQPEDALSSLLRLSRSEREKLRRLVLRVSSHPSEVFDLDMVVEDLCEGSKSVVDWTQTGLIWNGQDDESWVNLLTFAGFIVETGGAIRLPAKQTSLIEGIRCVLESLAEMSSESLKLLGGCTTDMGKPLLHLLSKALRGEKTEITDLELATLFGAGSQGRELLQSLDFEISDVDATPPGGRSCELHGAARAAYALWGEAEAGRHGNWCSLV